MPSIREEIADSLRDICVFGDLNDSYGVNKTKQNANGKSYWNVTFAKAGSLDGHIRVYSPNFIYIGWEGKYALAKGLPFRGKEIMKSESEARQFISKYFIAV